MPDALNIVLYPLVPTDGGDFQGRYLQGLSVSAYEVDVPNPVPAAAAQPPANLIGTAKYDDTVLTTNTSGILQHQVQPSLLTDVAASVASAVVLLPGPIDAGKPYVNVVLQIVRSSDPIADRSMNYDAPLVSVSTPIVGGPLLTSAGSLTAVPCFDLDSLAPSLYVGLAPPAGAIPSVTLPADGAPPSFAELLHAVTQVLAIDPAIIDPASPAPDLAALTPQQCTHIAREVLWQRSTVNPVPVANKATHDNVQLEKLYTGPPTAPPNPPGSFVGDDKDREEFQGALQSYYATLDAGTTRLAQYIFALSAALRCSQTAAAASSVELTFPVRAFTKAAAGQIAQATLRLQG
jgi:hypothetical protein